MYFHSLQFLAFAALLFAAYWAARRWRALRLGLLLAGSLLFYAAWTPFPLLLFAGVALVDWLCVRGMGRWPRAKKASNSSTLIGRAKYVSRRSGTRRATGSPLAISIRSRDGSSSSTTCHG